MKLPEQTAERVIIGIDPGTVVMGYGVLIVRGRTTALVTMGVLKLGRAQGAAIAAALNREIPIFEYAPLKIKMAITGNGQASKEQVAGMLQRILHIPEADMLPQLDATDGLAAAYCHYMQTTRPMPEKAYAGWKDFIAKNPGKVRGL